MQWKVNAEPLHQGRVDASGYCRNVLDMFLLQIHGRRMHPPDFCPITIIYRTGRPVGWKFAAHAHHGWQCFRFGICWSVATARSLPCWQRCAVQAARDRQRRFTSLPGTAERFMVDHPRPGRWS